MFITYPASYGALTQLWAGTAPEAESLNGAVSLRLSSSPSASALTSVRCSQYLVPWARVGAASAAAQDGALAKKLWGWLEEQAAAHPAPRPSQ